MTIVYVNFQFQLYSIERWTMTAPHNGKPKHFDSPLVPSSSIGHKSCPSMLSHGLGLKLIFNNYGRIRFIMLMYVQVFISQITLTY